MTQVESGNISLLNLWKSWSTEQTVTRIFKKVSAVLLSYDEGVDKNYISLLQSLLNNVLVWLSELLTHMKSLIMAFHS